MMATALASPLPLLTTREEPMSRGPVELASAIAQSSSGLSIFTANPISFVKAPQPQTSTVKPSVNYHVLDDATLIPSTPIKTTQEKLFIGPQLPPSLTSSAQVGVVDEPSSTAASNALPSSTTAPPSVSSSTSASFSSEQKHPRLWSGEISSSWPAVNGSIPLIGRGLNNTGNTCYLNSVLQCLLHTPPLLQMASRHYTERCKDEKWCGGKEAPFCMTRAFAETAFLALYNKEQGRRSVLPRGILSALKSIAKDLRKGRQEDAHEFLRYSIDAFQRSALAGTDPKLPEAVKETTWVHKIFGGKLRSRVHCLTCQHNSDTFDSVLDLSIEIFKQRSLKDALNAFVAIEKLDGKNLYNCEKCKKPVRAEKQFTIHEAPQILTVHLKRFTPLGRKLTQPINYPEQLSLKGYMSDGQFAPSYHLYGAIFHSGSGPNSGHYTAHVKSSKNTWYEMNDEYVDKDQIPLTSREAYILFYARDSGSSLQSAIHAATATSTTANAPASQTKGANLSSTPATTFVPPKVQAGKRKRTITQDAEDEEDVGVKISPSSLILSPSTRHLSPPPVKRPKSEATSTTSAAVQSALDALADYAGDSSEADDDLQTAETVKNDGDETMEDVEYGPHTPPPDDPVPPVSASSRADLIPDLFPIPSSNNVSTSMDVDRTAPEPARLSTVPTSRFYGNNKDKDRDNRGSGSFKKRRYSDENDRGGRKYSGDYDHRRRHGHGSPRKDRRKYSGGGGGGGNPLSGSVLTSNNLFEHRSSGYNGGGGGRGGGGGGWNGGGQGSTRSKMNKRKFH